MRIDVDDIVGIWWNDEKTELRAIECLPEGFVADDLWKLKSDDFLTIKDVDRPGYLYFCDCGCQRSIHEFSVPLRAIFKH
jgi:hypothetical protein